MQSNINHPKVTVITLCFNTGTFVIEALNCVKNQTYKNIELIIVDDSSSDNSVELIEGWIKENNFDCVFIKNSMNSGIPAVFNKALKQATGEFVTWISDDLWEHDRLKKSIEVFTTLPNNVGVMFGKMDYIDATGKQLWQNNPKEFLDKLNCAEEDKVQLSNSNFNIIPRNKIKNLLYHKCFIAAPSVTVRKSIYSKIGDYDETITVEDLDCWFKTSNFFDFVYVPVTFVKYRLHATNYSSGLNENYIKSLITVLNRHKLNDSKNKTVIKKHIREEAYRIGINLSQQNYIKKTWKYFFNYYLPNFQLNQIAIKETLKLFSAMLGFSKK